MGFWESVLDLMGGDDHQVFGVDEDFDSKKAEDNWNKRNSSSNNSNEEE